VILATTAAEIQRGAVEADYSTSFKKLAGIEAPLVLIYDARAFVAVGEKEYVFRGEADRRRALLAIFPIQKFPLPQGWMSSDEGMAYRGLVARAGGRIAEIGCWKGRSASYVARLARSMICVDHFTGSSDEYDAGYRRWPAGDVEAELRDHLARLGARHVELRVSSSVEAAAAVADGSLDLVFLDASHDEAAVRADVAAWLPKLRSGGILAGHDHDHPGVARAVAHLQVIVGPGSLYHAVVA
jgi:SAM-dependent methyltransferase